MTYEARPRTSAQKRGARVQRAGTSARERGACVQLARRDAQVLLFLLAVSLSFDAPLALAQVAPDSSAQAVADSLATPAVGESVSTAAPGTVLNARLIVRSRRVRLTGKANNVVRTGPGNGFAIAGVYSRDVTFTVIAKSGDWYGIRLSDSETGWVHASLCREIDDLSGLEFRPNPKLFTRTGSYVLSAYGGAYAFDRKSNSLVLGGRLGYYVFDRLQFEAGLSWTHVRRSPEVVESLFGLSLEAEDFNMAFYNLNATWELLPGRQMVPYVSAGVGSTIMLGRSEPSLDFGAGTKMFLSRRSAMRWEVRDYRFKTGPDAARVTNHNIEFTLCTEYLF